MSRPGFSPINPEDDRFAIISSVKDRMGSLVSVPVGWHGLTGRFSELSDEDKIELNNVKERRKEEKAAKASGDGVRGF
jgi:hypothetical protein